MAITDARPNSCAITAIIHYRNRGVIINQAIHEATDAGGENRLGSLLTQNIPVGCRINTVNFTDDSEKASDNTDGSMIHGHHTG